MKRNFYDVHKQSFKGKKKYSYVACVNIGEEIKQNIYRTKRSAIEGAKLFSKLLQMEGEKRPISIHIIPVDR